MFGFVIQPIGCNINEEVYSPRRQAAMQTLQ